ncbi:uncharacterized protein LOC119393168 [Rhipicephalus sanguineus]|uniref:uncharacterized protein LOC119393168 n=1 Tax=Rhipicephalus sanguineus TaxID=34632 RepID=UPI001894F1FB|nr:uncharacterized protein LOC119393168 [Rhipicephalus sanguineus]
MFSLILCRDAGRCCARCLTFVGVAAVVALATVAVLIILGVVNIKVHYVTSEARKGDENVTSSSSSQSAKPHPSAESSSAYVEADTRTEPRGRSPGDEHIPDPRF